MTVGREDPYTKSLQFDPPKGEAATQTNRSCNGSSESALGVGVTIVFAQWVMLEGLPSRLVLVGPASWQNQLRTP